MGGSRIRPKRKPEPTPVQPAATILPRGPVETPNPNGQGFGAQWENLHPHYDLIAREATPRGLPIPLVVAVGLIESGWNQTWPSGPNRGKVIEVHDNYGGGPSVGFMQVKPYYWQALIPTADAYTIAGNVALGCELLKRKIKERGSWQEAIKRDYHPGVSPNGTTPESYVRCITALIAEIETAGGDVSPTKPITYGNVSHPTFQDRPIQKAAGNGWDDLGPRQPKGVVLHRMIGSLWGTDGYFRRPEVGALTDYGVGVLATDTVENDGVILRWNDPLGRRSGWASGPVSKPYGDGALFVGKYGANAVNRDLVSIEVSGNYETALSPKAFESVCALVAYWADRCKVPWTAFPVNPATGISCVFWHQEFTLGTGKICPGPVMIDATPRIIDRAKAILQAAQGGEAPLPPPPPKPRFEGLTIPEAVFLSLWPQEVQPDPAGAFTKHIIEGGAYPKVYGLHREGKESWLTTSLGVLHFKDGKVEAIEGANA